MLILAFTDWSSSTIPPTLQNYHLDIDVFVGLVQAMSARALVALNRIFFAGLFHCPGRAPLTAQEKRASIRGVSHPVVVTMLWREDSKDVTMKQRHWPKQTSVLIKFLLLMARQQMSCSCQQCDDLRARRS